MILQKKKKKKKNDTATSFKLYRDKESEHLLNNNYYIKKIYKTGTCVIYLYPLYPNIIPNIYPVSYIYIKVKKAPILLIIKIIKKIYKTGTRVIYLYPLYRNIYLMPYINIKIKKALILSIIILKNLLDGLLNIHVSYI